MMRKINLPDILLINLIVLLLLPLSIHAQILPASFIAFRDNVYMQNKNPPETMRLYSAAKQEIERALRGADMYLALSRCEYIMGIFFWADGQNSEAAPYFERGIERAEEALKLHSSSEGYRFLGANIALLCEVKRSYALGNFGKIEENATKALELDPNNLPAMYLIAARYIISPWPLANVRKGTSWLEEILKQNYLSMEKDDLFNFYLMFEAACLKQKKNAEAKIWHERAAALYPADNTINLLIKG